MVSSLGDYVLAGLLIHFSTRMLRNSYTATFMCTWCILIRVISSMPKVQKNRHRFFGQRKNMHQRTLKRLSIAKGYKEPPTSINVDALLIRISLQLHSVCLHPRGLIKLCNELR